MENQIYDTLTGLPSKELFDNNLALAIASSKRSGEKTVVLMIENPAGMFDDWLVEISKRLRSAVRSTDTVALLDKNTFGLVLTQLKDSDNAVRVADALIHKTREPYAHNGKQLRFHPLIGMAVCPDDASSSEDLLRNAAQALVGAKSNIVGRYAFYTEDMNARVHKRRTLLSTLAGAWRNNEFVICAQPDYDLSGKWVSTHLSLRWEHPTEGQIMESEFYPLATEVGLYQEMLDFVCSVAQESSKLHTDKRWSFNIAPTVDQRILSTYVPTLNADTASYIGLTFDEESLSTDASSILEMMSLWRTRGGYVNLASSGKAKVSGDIWSALPLQEIRISLSNASKFTKALANSFDLRCTYVDALVGDVGKNVHAANQSQIQPPQDKPLLLADFLNSTPPNLF